MTAERMVSVEEARIHQETLVNFTLSKQTQRNLAYTVEQQAEQIAAVRALHFPRIKRRGCGHCGRHWPCSTVRALGDQS